MMAQIHIRNIDEQTVRELKARAGARALTVAQLIKSLLALHAGTQTLYEGSQNDVTIEDLRALLNILELEPHRL